MKRIASLDEKMVSLEENNDPKSDMPTIRKVIQYIGATKAETADDCRKINRILNKVRDKNVTELLLETDDHNFLVKLFEKNATNLTAWAQGQILEILENADKVEAK